MGIAGAMPHNRDGGNEDCGKNGKSPDALHIRALFMGVSLLRRVTVARHARWRVERFWGMTIAFRNCRRAASPPVKSLWGGGPGGGPGGGGGGPPGGGGGGGVGGF